MLKSRATPEAKPQEAPGEVTAGSRSARARSFSHPPVRLTSHQMPGPTRDHAPRRETFSSARFLPGSSGRIRLPNCPPRSFLLSELAKVPAGGCSELSVREQREIRLGRASAGRYRATSTGRHPRGRRNRRAFAPPRGTLRAGTFAARRTPKRGHAPRRSSRPRYTWYGGRRARRLAHRSCRPIPAT